MTILLTTYGKFNQLADGTSEDTDIEHVLLAYDSTNKQAKVYLDDQLGGGDQDLNDMTVWVNDTQPVPEPATIFLLGAGLIGLTGVSRKRFLK